MDKTELKYLIDNKLITNTSKLKYYMDSVNEEELKKLKKKDLVNNKEITQVGYLDDYHTFQIIALNGEGKPCGDCTIYINNNPQNVTFVKHGDKPEWKVLYKNIFSNVIIEEPILKDTILVITVSGSKDSVEVLKQK